MENNFVQDNSMDLKEIAKTYAEQQNQDIDGETAVVGNSEYMRKVAKDPENTEPDIKDRDENIVNHMDNIINQMESDTSFDEDEDIIGGGIIIDNEQEKEMPYYTGITPETQSNIDAYLENMQSDMEEVRSKNQEELLNYNMATQEFEAKDTSSDGSDDSDDDDELSKDSTKDEFERNYEKAIVVIDKSKMGTVIDFTDEERKKLERAKVIKLEEIENKKISAIKTKKLKKNKLDNIIKNITTAAKSNIVLPISGYTAIMRGCSAHELINLIGANSTGVLATELQNKWSLIYDKIESTSIGKMSYNDFLMNTASVELNMFIYGILCATYPNDDSISLTCNKCGKEFKHDFTIKSLIRAEKMSDRIKGLIMDAVDNSISEDRAKQCHDHAPISTVKTIELPSSGIIVDFHVQSAYDFINKSAPEFGNKNRDTKYEDTNVLSTTVAKLYLPDEEDPDGAYYEVDDATDISKVIYAMDEIDTNIFEKIANDTLDGLIIDFGLMDITCPSCKDYTPSVPMNIEEILFYKYQQSKNTRVE